jgi:hypothetical protein
MEFTTDIQRYEKANTQDRLLDLAKRCEALQTEHDTLKFEEIPGMSSLEEWLSNIRETRASAVKRAVQARDARGAKDCQDDDDDDDDDGDDDDDDSVDASPEAKLASELVEELDHEERDGTRRSKRERRPRIKLNL